MGCRLGLVGANTATGELVVELFQSRKMEVDELISLASDPYETDSIIFNKKNVLPLDISDFDFSKADIIIFADDESLINTYGVEAQKANAFVIDCSQSEREKPSSLLVVPEVNADILKGLTPKTILCNPSPAGIFVAMVLSPLLKNYELVDVNACCLMPAVHHGKGGVEELVGQTARLLNGMPVENTVFSQQLAFSVLPETSSLDESGYSHDELTLMNEIGEIFAGHDYSFHATCIQVPVFHAQSQIITITTTEPITVKDVTGLLSKSSGITAVSNNKLGPTAIKNAAGKDGLFVGRIRQPAGQNHKISFWSVGENLRKGAALNSVQIAEILIKSSL